MAAQKQAPSPASVMVALLLLAAATPLAHGQLNLPKGSTIYGQVCCTSTGNCPQGVPGIPGVPLNLTCSTQSRSVNIGGVTGLNGFYNFTVPTLVDLLGSDTFSCAVVISHPLNQTVCPVLSNAGGFLVGFPSLLITLVSLLLGLTGNITVRAFIHLLVSV